MSRKKVIKNIAATGLAERGNRLESWWKSKGWSKAEFAQRMSIWPQNVNKYFSGELDPTNLIEQLMKEDCDVVWIIDGKSEKEPRGMVSEPSAEYGKKRDRIPSGMSDQTRGRVKKLIKLLESGPEKTDEEMLDLLIKTMEVRQKKKGKCR
ncbi:MAG: helix-turn-helix transcriptional regulator [Bacteroidota bacterium]